MIVVSALAIGAVVGLVLGALGAGGAMLTVPALVFVLGLPMYTAGTVALLVTTTAAVTGLLPRPGAPAPRIGTGLTFGAVGLPAAWLGGRLAPHVPERLLLAAFVTLAFAAAARMLWRERGERRDRDGNGRGRCDRDGDDRSWRDRPGQDADDVPGRRRAHPAHPAHPAHSAHPAGPARPLRVMAVAGGVGLLTGLLGVGGGFLIVPALVLTLGLSMPEAARTSLLVITVNGAGAIAGRWNQLPDLPWQLVAVLACGAVLGRAVGGRIATRTDPTVLSRAFALLLVCAALATAASTA
ncbi:sulfite exporter TauE/SafE family protein [Streptomyces sp. NPDC003077]|uniref:sulfite exporter TauE/SafE family protein n=1 Tax=Streptomyces sp. NPDC003077 TaxID=3154443 RepID=UPI0033BCFA83